MLAAHQGTVTMVSLTQWHQHVTPVTSLLETLLALHLHWWCRKLIEDFFWHHLISKYFSHLGNKELANHISFFRRLKHDFNVADKNITLAKLFHYYGFKENGFKE